MTKIEDLITQIPDERLRKAIAVEVKTLKKTKQFGLVFEEHLPETVRLPNLPVAQGELVVFKSQPANQPWRVRRVFKGKALCEPAVEPSQTAKETAKEFSVDSLVVVRNFWRPNLSCTGPGRPHCAGRARKSVARTHQRRQLSRSPTFSLLL